MKLIKTLLVSAALAATFAAHADVTPTLGGTSGSFLTLTSTPTGGTLGSYTITGGTVYTTDEPFASDPNESGIPLFGGNFLAAGPTAGQSATIDFGTVGIDYISFLWGSPDTYNNLTITGTGGFSQTYTATSLGFPVTNGTQTFAEYVQFAATAGTMITSLSFTNIPSVDAFEVANFSVTPVPEPETYALLLAGLGAMAFVARRRNNA